MLLSHTAAEGGTFSGSLLWSLFAGALRPSVHRVIIHSEWLFSCQSRGLVGGCTHPCLILGTVWLARFTFAQDHRIKEKSPQMSGSIRGVQASEFSLLSDITLWVNNEKKWMVEMLCRLSCPHFDFISCVILLWHSSVSVKLNRGVLLRPPA